MKACTEKANTLQNTRIVIIGGSSGIGLAVALAASAKGANVIVVSSNQQRVDAALELLPSDCSGCAVDMTDEVRVRNFFEGLGKFDHLVYTAGENLSNGSVNDLDLASARKYFETRYWGAVTTIKYAGANINPKGSVVFTSGIASNRPNKTWGLGASICAAMEGFTRAMAMELAPVRVNIVSPGVVKTNLWSNMTESDRDAMYKNLAKSLPVQRAGLAEDIAKAYIFLMEQEFATGQTLIVDGGASLV